MKKAELMLELINNSKVLRAIIGGIIIIASIFMLPFLLSSLNTDQISYFRVEAAADPHATDTKQVESPNAVAVGVATMVDSFGQSVNTAEQTISNGSKSVVDTTVAAGKSVSDLAIRSTKAILFGMFKGIAFVGTGVGNTVVFLVGIPIKLVHAVTNIPTLSSLIRPADNAEVPVIDTQLEELYAAHPDLTTAEPAAEAEPQAHVITLWPIHGKITTRFGVPHRPYQDTHTGLDISSGNRSGVMQIKPFRAGKVVDVILSRKGLGNHLVIDHGGGISSVYAHMSSISVTAGQQVDENTILGYEGSTGASTGPHLHFEIRVNGQPVDPHQYISGQP